MSNTQHIVMFVDFYKPHLGGVETVFSAIVERLLQRGYQISIITSRFDRSLPAKEKDKKLTIHRVGKGRISYMYHAYRKGQELLREDSSVSLLHASSYSGIRPMVLLARKYHKPSLATVHEVFGKLRNRRKRSTAFFYRMFERSLFWVPADMYHCVSYYTFNALRLLYGVPDDRLCVIHNGVDESRSQHTTSLVSNFTPSTEREGKYLILYYGHAGTSKGIDFLIEAIPGIVEKIPHAHFIFNLIPSKRTNATMKRIKRLQETYSLTLFSGMEKNDLHALIDTADVVVAPSLAEGFGSVVSEVSSVGTPLVTTYAGAIPEASWGAVTYARPSSSLSLIEKIYQTYSRDSSLKFIPPKKFSWDYTVSQLEDLYGSLIDRKNKKK